MQIKILETAWKKIRYLTTISPIEISGLGYVEQNGNSFLISDVYLLKQINSPTSTELDQEDVSNLIIKLLEEGKNPGNLRFWWHSHVNMGCFWSGTDESCVDSLTLDKFLISLVTTKNENYKMRFDLKVPVNITLDDLELEIVPQVDNGLYQACLKEFKEKI